jgi:hypothetical protein
MDAGKPTAASGLNVGINSMTSVTIHGSVLLVNGN